MIEVRPFKLKRDIFYILLTLYIWAIPAAVFWQMTLKLGVMLPWVPNFAWKIPGELWQSSPVAYVTVLLLSTVLLFFIQPRLDNQKWIKYVLIAVVCIFILIHYFWGGALLKVTNH